MAALGISRTGVKEWLALGLSAEERIYKAQAALHLPCKLAVRLSCGLSRVVLRKLQEFGCPLSSPLSWRSSRRQRHHTSSYSFNFFPSASRGQLPYSPSAPRPLVARTPLLLQLSPATPLYLHPLVLVVARPIVLPANPGTF
ncbi:predicted protein [Histoplasma capsulatum G186AR]|uniref:Uncharacterized protein n=1 Tax=Ajellomyces capsulatus (strain G186AR / H82 / ATCC MYA-2454 / RMSCC 2432) TaxID=447093 RepID=C0NX10_AJECG|nr:uncharacterized protein HCBG_08002 [Histoplasma capsulatum G186AR]EEH03876.1 predicted protein [Histoplasma capsulatum G186AR]